jgi:hypothetical protein
MVADSWVHGTGHRRRIACRAAYSPGSRYRQAAGDDDAVDRGQTCS